MLPNVWPKELQLLTSVFSSFLLTTAKGIKESRDRLYDLSTTITEIIRSEDELRILIDSFKSNVISYNARI